MKHVVITGASGFVGEHLAVQLAETELYTVTAVSRRPPLKRFPGVDYVVCKDISVLAEIEIASEVHTVIHTAGLAHVSNSQVDADRYERVNSVGCDAVVEAAVKWGARQIVHFSTSKVYDENLNFQPISEETPVAPLTVYARSKLAGEKRLVAGARNEGVRLLIVRPPVIYGSGVKANMALLSSFIKWMPVLPFCALKEQRSALGIRNLVDFISCVIQKEPALPFESEVFVISDSEAVSTHELSRRIAKALRLHRLSFCVPLFMLRAGAACLGKREAFAAMAQPFRLEGRCALKYYDWRPPYSLQQELNFWLEG